MMEIKYHENERLFHLKNKDFSYVVGVLENDHLGHFYFGKAIDGPLKQEYFRADQNKGLTSNVFEGNPSFSLNNERLEFPCFGSSDFRQSAFEIQGPCGSQIMDFKYYSHEIVEGKSGLKGMPAARGPALTLNITLMDNIADLKLILSYSIFEVGTMTRRSSIENMSRDDYYLDKFMSMSMDLPDRDWEMVQFSGDWIRERHLYQTPLRPGIQSIYSNRGASSANHNPSLLLQRKGSSETAGEVIALSFIYSGNFLIQTEVDSNNITRLMTGISPDYFRWQLKPNDVFETPQVVMTYSDQGLHKISHNLHEFVKTHILDAKWRHHPRPIVLNNWEATYFDFDEDKIVNLAEEGAKLGVEMFVLDDGWFGNRNSDQTGLGDWFVNLKKLPNGIKGLSERIHNLDMKFGLWIEPEMVNKDTRLIKEHPDFLIGHPKRKISHGRNQYVLDFSRDEVVDNIFNQLTQVLDGAQVDYIKWDMNKNITEAFSSSLGADRQGELFHRYILGVYKLYDLLIKRYPNTMIESCASGGGRFDLGMMYYAPQAWTSDDTDAVERLKIQHATSMIFPLQTMASHVSAVPNHQVMRMTSLKMRGDVANFGTFGYELDVTKLSEVEKHQIKDQIKTFQSLRNLIHEGEFYRLSSPFESNETAWLVVDDHQESAFLSWFQVLSKPNEPIKYLKLQGLDPHKLYQVSDHKDPMSGSLLMHQGILIKPSFNGVEKLDYPMGDFQSRTWTIEALK